MSTALATPDSDLFKDLDEELTVERVEGEYLSRNFRQFISAAWPYVETAPFIPGWHIDAMADHLEAVSYGEIENLIINISPGCTKSLTASVLWPAWEWGWQPWVRWFMESYDEALVLRDAKKTRELVRKPWYQARWPMAFKGDSQTMGRYENTDGGWRISTMIGGHGTGEHMHRRVTDDPLNREEMASETKLQGVIDWNDQTMSTRGQSLKVSHVVVMQRLAENDLSGHLLSEECKDRGYVHLCLPMRYEPKRMVQTPLGWEDPRTVEGQLMAPQQFDEAKVRRMEKTLGTMGAAGQLQQRPAAAGGNVVQREWIRFWNDGDVPDGPLVIDGKEYLSVLKPETFDQVIQSWDYSYKDELGQLRKGKLPDPVAGGVVARHKSSVYLLDGIGGVMDVVKGFKALVTLTRKWPKAKPRLVEDRANGPAIMAMARRKSISTLGVTPRRGKLQRVRESAPDQRSKDARSLAMSAMIEGGDFYMPDPRMPGYAWVTEVFRILCAFPNVPHDDWVDMLSQAFAYLSRFIDREAQEAKGDLEDMEDDHEGEEPPKTLAEAVAREDRKRMEDEEEDLEAEYNANNGNGNGGGDPRSTWFR